MATANPYQPPRADVADVYSEATEFQDVALWSAAGRIGRLRYLAYLGASYLLFALFAGIGGGISAAARSPNALLVIMGLFGIVYGVWVIMKAIQRSHDMGWSGWTVLLTLIPFVAFIWFLKGGTPGNNAYGAPPPPNTTAVKILSGVFIVFFVGGILAAIVLPSYMTHTKKPAQVQAQP